MEEVVHHHQADLGAGASRQFQCSACRRCHFQAVELDDIPRTDDALMLPNPCLCPSCPTVRARHMHHVERHAPDRTAMERYGGTVTDDEPRLGLFEHGLGQQSMSAGAICRLEPRSLDVGAPSYSSQDTHAHEPRQVTVRMARRLQLRPQEDLSVGRGEDLVHGPTVNEAEVVALAPGGALWTAA